MGHPKGTCSFFLMSLGLVYKHNQSIERTTIYNLLSDTFVLLLSDEKVRRKAGGPLPTQELTVEKHSRTPATSGRIGVLGTRRPLSVAVVPPRPPRPVTATTNVRRTGCPSANGGAWAWKRQGPGGPANGGGRCMRTRRRLDRTAAATAPNACDGCGGGASHRSTGAAAALGNGAAALRAAQGRRPQRAAEDPHPHGGGGSSRDQGRRPFETNPERPAPLLFYRPVTMDGLVWAL